MTLGLLATVLTLVCTTDGLRTDDANDLVRGIHPAQYDPYYHRGLVDHATVTLPASAGENPATWYDFYNHIQMKPATDPKALEEKYFTLKKKRPCVGDSLSISSSPRPAGTQLCNHAAPEREA